MVPTLALWLESRLWRASGRRARLWWRDDDAATPTPELERLLQVSAGLPLALAVVPSGDMTGLAATLAGFAAVTPIQHGVDHRNRREGPAAGEFPGEWTIAEVRCALDRGRRRLQRLPRAQAIFAPPWNDVHPALPAALAEAGYLAWSANGGLHAGEGATDDAPARFDVHLDLMRWRGGARFRGGRRMLDGLAAEMRRRRLAGLWDAPVGLLTHHLDHDEAAWAFLAAFLAWSAEEPVLAWTSLPQLVCEARAPRALALARGL